MIVLRRALTSMTAAAVLLLGSVAATAPANAEIYSTGVFSVPYNGDLYNVGADGAIMKLTYPEWQALGSPEARPAPTNFVRYRWSPSVYAVTFFGTERDEWVWSSVSYEQWDRAGRPEPREAGWIAGTYFYGWATSSEIFSIAPDGAYRKLAYGEWLAAGSPAPDDRSNEGFYKYSWDSTITRITNITAGQGRGISYSEWKSEAFPTPQVVARVPGDSVYQYYGQSDIWYAGPAFNRVITGNEWAAMGYPAPSRIDPPRPADDKDCGSYSFRRYAQADFDYWYPLYADVFGLDGNRDSIACNALPW